MKISLSPKNCSCYYDDLKKVTTGALPRGSGAHITAKAAVYVCAQDLREGVEPTSKGTFSWRGFLLRRCFSTTVVETRKAIKRQRRFLLLSMLRTTSWPWIVCLFYDSIANRTWTWRTWRRSLQLFLLFFSIWIYLCIIVNHWSQVFSILPPKYGCKSHFLVILSHKLLLKFSKNEYLIGFQTTLDFRLNFNTSKV